MYTGRIFKIRKLLQNPGFLNEKVNMTRLHEFFWTNYLSYSCLGLEALSLIQYKPFSWQTVTLAREP